jgi:hypothetical protein
VIEHRRSDDSIINLTTYSYDDVGNRIGALEHDGTVTTWIYDDGYHLTREQRSGSGGFDVSYSYDSSGIRTLQDGSGALILGIGLRDRLLGNVSTRQYCPDLQLRPSQLPDVDDQRRR